MARRLGRAQRGGQDLLPASFSFRLRCPPLLLSVLGGKPCQDLLPASSSFCLRWKPRTLSPGRAGFQARETRHHSSVGLSPGHRLPAAGERSALFASRMLSRNRRVGTFSVLILSAHRLAKNLLLPLSQLVYLACPAPRLVIPSIVEGSVFSLIPSLATRH
jgi:hypothetical protein